MTKIAIVTPNSDTFTNPAIIAMFLQLKKRGVEVYLFGPAQQPSCPSDLANLKVILSRFKLYLLRNPRHYLSQWLSYFRVFQTIRKEKIKAILAVDPLGLIIGGRVKKLLGKKIHLSYLSFEIFFRDELQGYYLNLKEKEIRYSAFIDSLLIQDEKRKELLIKENRINLPDDKVTLVPVSPAKIEITEKPDIYKEFSIPRDKKLAVYSGSVGRWCGTDVIIEAFRKGYWDNDYWLVFHTRTPLDRNNPYYDDLTRMHNDPGVPFSLHPLPFKGFDELAEFLSGFDLALALYYPNNENPYYGRNMKEIGLSSGKFSTYIMLGLPVIVTPCEIYTRLLSTYRFGAVLEDILSLKDVIQNINSSKTDINKLYHDILDPEPAILSYVKLISGD
jgi:hypothetical protein